MGQPTHWRNWTGLYMYTTLKLWNDAKLVKYTYLCYTELILPCKLRNVSVWNRNGPNYDTTCTGEKVDRCVNISSLLAEHRRRALKKKTWTAWIIAQEYLEGMRGLVETQKPENSWQTTLGQVETVCKEKKNTNYLGRMSSLRLARETLRIEFNPHQWQDFLSTQPRPSRPCSLPTNVECNQLTNMHTSLLVSGQESPINAISSNTPLKVCRCANSSHWPQ